MAQKFLSINNFEKYQHKRKEGSPYIKLPKSILGDPEFMRLTPHDRYVFLGLLLLADDCNNRICNDHEYLARRLYIFNTEHIQGDTKAIRNTYTPCTKLDLKPLYRSGLLFTSNLSRELSDSGSEFSPFTNLSPSLNSPSLPPNPNLNLNLNLDLKTSEQEVVQKPIVKLVPKVINRGCAIPEDFTFNERAQEMAKGYGINPHKELASFRDYHVANGTVFKDWQAAFRNWLRNAVKFAAKGGR